TIPDAPTIGTVSYGPNPLEVLVYFTLPSSDGGSPITSYTCTSSPGSISGSGSSSPVTVSGLTAGTTYTFVCAANNADGTGADSSSSNSITAADTPTAPTIGSAALSTITSISVDFTINSGNGASISSCE